jgi:hypothetical protein
MCRKELVETNDEDEDEGESILWTDDERPDDYDSDEEDDEDEEDEDDEEDEEDEQENNENQHKKLTIQQVHEAIKKQGFNENDLISFILSDYFDLEVKTKKEVMKRSKKLMKTIEKICDRDIEVDHRDTRTYASVVLGIQATEEPGRGPSIVHL